MAVLINGNGYSPVTAQQDADLYGGILGLPLTVLAIGQQMAATIVDANTVRIGDGEAVVQGRRIHNDPGEYDDFTIPSAGQGVTAYYIIGYHLYTDTSGNELCEPFVRQMSSATETITEAVLRDGATEAYISFYRVTMSGVAVSAVQKLFIVSSPVTSAHGIGSVVVTRQNENPGTALGGTWELFEKEYRYQFIRNPSGVVWNSATTQNQAFIAIINNKTIELRFEWSNKTALSDDTILLCTIPLSTIGINGSYAHTTFFSAWCDAANAIGMGQTVLDGSNLLFRVHDWITRGGSFPTTTGMQCVASVSFVAQGAVNELLDSFCDRFYWRRTA